MFARLRLSTRLSLLLGFVVAALLAVAGYGLFALRQAQASAAAAIELSADLVQAIGAARAAEVASKVQVQEFKNILLRGQEQQDYDRHFAAFRTRSDAIARGFAEAREAMERRGLPTGAVDDAQRLQSGILQAHLEALKSFDASRPDAARAVDALVRGKDQPLGDKIAEIVRAVEDFAQQETASAAEAAAARAKVAVALYLALVAAAAAVALLVGTLVIRGLLRELGGEPGYAREVAERIADGDLSLQVRVRPGDRGSVLLAMRTMADNLRTLVGEVAAGARGVADTSAQIAQGNADLSQRTEEQASTLEETASQMEELTATVTQNAGNARAARELAVGASEVAGKGGEVVGAVVRTMSGISEASRRIGDIIGVIDAIAFQTNILALNAAVEAARAGEQGRGFAVVAAEVRNLAQRSAEAAREIKGLIGNSVQQVDAGTGLVDAAGRTMQDIVASVKKVSDLIADIAVASEEQSAGIGQVSTAVAQMDRVVQQNAALVEEASAATEAMTAQADALLRKVARFRLADGAGAAPEAGADATAANANAFELTYVY